MNIEEMERALIKRYRTKLYTPFCKAIGDYDLIQPNDKIAVCISGGKDSLTMAKLFQELKRHGKIPFEVKYLVMNPGYNEENLNSLIENAKKMGIPIKIKESNVFKVSNLLGEGHPCYLCAKMRRGFLYDFAKEEGCNKIALGHHFNDVIETTLLNVFYAGTFKTMVPKLKSTNHPGMELIRPMVYVEENNIKNYIDYCEIKAMGCGCSVASGEIPSKRREVKEFIAKMKKEFKDFDKSVFSAGENVNLNCVTGWYFKDKRHSFLEYYDEECENEENTSCLE